MRNLIVALLIVLATAPVLALEPGEALNDPALEARARDLMGELRCLVCQAESIEDSPAPFAAEVRALVREQLAAGESDTEIKQFLVARYGEEILYRPRWRPGTWLLWLGPFVALGLGAIVVAFTIHSSSPARVHADRLSEDEEGALKRLLERD